MEYRCDIINDISGKKNDNNKSTKISETKQTDLDIYIISCFSTFIWDKELFILKSNNSRIKTIQNALKEKLFYDSNFYIIIHKITITEKIKKIELFLFSETSKKILNLNEIVFNPEKEFVLFTDIDINPYEINLYKKEIKEQNLVRLLKENEKLKIYYDYFNQKEVSGVLKLKINLAMQYLKECEKNDKIIFSDIIIVFCLAFGQKIITNFLDTYIKFDIEIDKMDIKNFNDILSLYNNDKNKFYEKNKKHFEKKGKVEEYNIALENFIIIYKLLNKQTNDISKKQIKNVRKVLLKLINNKKEIMRRICFIFYIFDSLSLVMHNDNLKHVEPIKIVVKSNDDLINSNFGEFNIFYQELIKSQEKQNKYFLDFSDVFNKFVDLNDDTEILIDIKKSYEKELTIFRNSNFEKKIRDKIHKTGVQKITQGKYNNIFLIRFLKYDCPEKYKNFELLKYFKIDLMDDNFFNKFNQDKIYTLFESNFAQYLKEFATNIIEIKNFGLFFKILPADMYDKDSISFLFNWIKKYINTLDIEKCKNFKSELLLLFKIMAKNSSNNFIIELIKLILDNIKTFFVDICISLLNQKMLNTNVDVINVLITNLIFSNENSEDNLNFENLNTLLINVELNRQILKIFFLKIEKYSLKTDDFFDKNNTRFKLFETLLYFFLQALE
mgnify:CR=1 FL=1